MEEHSNNKTKTKQARFNARPNFDEPKRKKKLRPRIKDIIFFIIVIVGLLMFVYQKFTGDDQQIGLDNVGEVAKVVVGGDAEIVAEIANTDEVRVLGLGNRDSMPMNRGMLFVHDSAERHVYSMRGMRFDLDFIFIRDGKVVDIAKNVAMEYRGTIKGASDYDSVLEVNANWVRANDVKIGEEIIFEE